MAEGDQFNTEYLYRLTPEQMLERYKNLTPSEAIYGGRFGGYGSSEDALFHNVYNTAKSMLGRDISSNEFAKILPYFYGPQGMATGRSYLASLAETDKQNLGEKAKGEYGNVGNVFNDLLKRGASQAELEHFGKMLASGDTDLYELSQFVKEMPEYRTAEDEKFRGGLANELQGYDTQFFRKASPEILNQYAKAGIQNSSALDYALTDLMGNLASKRGEYLSGLSASQYGGNRDLARQDYLNSMNQYLRGQDRTRGYQDALMNRAWEGADYATQRNDYMNYLNSMGSRRRGGAGGAIGTIGGGIVGGIVGGPAGAMAGSTIGQGAGSLFDYYN